MQRSSGFSLVELLAAIGIGGVLLAGALGLFTSHTRGYMRQDIVVVMQDNMRMAMDLVADTARGAGDGVPDAGLSTWIPWVDGFTTSPLVVRTSPPGLSVARCASQTVARITSSPAATNATTIELMSAISGLALADALDTGAKRLIVIDDREPAHVTAVNGDSITIDTNPNAPEAQGLSRGYPVGTPVCRIDVLTFAVVTNELTGKPELQLDVHHGDPAQTIAEGVNDLQVATVVAGRAYRLSLSAQTPLPDPVTGAYLTGGLQSDITLRN